MTPAEIKEEFVRLADHSGAEAQAVRRVAEAYNARVIELNERLRRAASLLDFGLLAEAIHALDLAPPVIESLTELDLGDRHDDCAALAAHFGTPLHSEPNWIVAERLSEAYARHRELAPLLAKHRRLAIGRAPVRQRLRTLREILARDPDPPTWHEQVAELERGRVQEINREAKRAYADAKLATIDQLIEEVADSRWIDPPPPALMAGLVDVRDRINTALAHREYRRSGEEMVAALSAGDRARAREAEARWDRTVASSGVKPPAEVAALAAPAQAELAQERATAEGDRLFAVACADLDRALDEDAPEVEVERLLAAAERFERPLPEVLRRRAQRALAQGSAERGRRFRLRLAVVVGAILLLATTVVVVLQQQRERQRIAGWAAQIEALVEAGDATGFDGLRARMEAEDPSLAVEPAIASALRRAESMLAEDRVRLAALEESIAAIDSAATRAETDAATARARRLARSAAEHALVDGAESAATRRRGEAQRASDETFSGLLQSWRERSRTLRDGFTVDRAEIDELRRVAGGLSGIATEIGAEIDQRRRDVPGGAPPPSRSLIAQAELVATEASTIASQVSTLAAERESIDRRLATIRGRTGSATALATALREFAEAHPATGLAVQFQAVLVDAEAWAAVEAWREIAGGAAPTAPGTTPSAAGTAPNSSDALHRIALAADDRLSDFLRNHPRAPRRAALRALVEYARVFDAAGGGPSDDGVRTLVEHPLISDLNVVRLASGGRMHVGDDAAIRPMGGDYVEVSQVLQNPNDLGESRNVLLPASSLAQPPEVRPSGQTIWSRFASDRLDSAAPHEFDIVLLDLLRVLVEEVDDIDEIAQFSIARLLVTAQLKRAWIELPELSGWLARSAAIDAGQNWLDHERTRERSRVAAQCAASVAELPSPTELIERTRRRRAEILEQVTPWSMAGLIWLDDDGAPMIEGPGGADRHFVLVGGRSGAEGGDGGRDFVEVARRRGAAGESTIEWTTDDRELLRPGTPLWTRRR